MEFVRPPTDNLYKFIAIGGLALTIAALVVPPQFLSEGNKQFNDLQRKKEGILTDGGLIMLRWLPHNEVESYAVPTPYITALGEPPTLSEKKGIFDHYLDLEKKILKRCNIPAPDDEQSKEYWMHILHIDAAAYKKMVDEPDADNLLNQTIKTSRAELKDIRALPALAAEQYDIQEMGTLVKEFRKWGWWVGLFLVFVGFGLWYWKVQRYLDATLRAQATMNSDPAKKPKVIFAYRHGSRRSRSSRR